MSITPPPAPDRAAERPAPGSAAPRTAPQIVSILAIVLGGLIILGTIVTSGVPLVLGVLQPRTTSTLTADAAGVTELSVDSSAHRMTVVFADVPEASLALTRTAGEWTFRRDGTTLRVESPRWWFGDLLLRGGEATLTLPRAIEGTRLAADLGVSAGDVRVDGRFGALKAELSAGNLELRGEAVSLDLGVSAGDAEVSLTVADSLGVNVSAGRVVGDIGGAGPRATRVHVSAGSVDLLLPDTAYSIDSEVSAGSFDHGLRSTSSASRTVFVAVSAGSVDLRPAR